MSPANTNAGERDKIRAILYGDHRFFLYLADKVYFEKNIHMIEARSNVPLAESFDYYLASAMDYDISATAKEKRSDATFGCLSPLKVLPASDPHAHNYYVSIFSGEDLKTIQAAVATKGRLIVGYDSEGRTPTILLMAILMMKCKFNVCDAFAHLASVCPSDKLRDDFTFSSFKEFESLFGLLTPDVKRTEIDQKCYKCFFDVDNNGCARLKVEVIEKLKDVIERGDGPQETRMIVASYFMEEMRKSTHDSMKAVLFEGGVSGQAMTIFLAEKDIFESMTSRNADSVNSFSYYLASAKDCKISPEAKKKCSGAKFGCLSPEKVSSKDYYSSIFSGTDLQTIQEAIATKGRLIVGYDSEGRRPTLLLMAILLMKCECPVQTAFGCVAMASSPDQLQDDFTFSSFSEFESLLGLAQSSSESKSYKYLFDIDAEGCARLKITTGLRRAMAGFKAAQFIQHIHKGLSSYHIRR